MKKISLNEEFVLNGWVYVFTQKESGISLKKIRESKSKAEFIPPTLDEVKSYFKSEGYPESLAEQFHKSYSSNNWKDSNDRPVKAWRMKAVNVWFKPANKESLTTTETKMVR